MLENTPPILEKENTPLILENTTPILENTPPILENTSSMLENTSYILKKTHLRAQKNLCVRTMCYIFLSNKLFSFKKEHTEWYNATLRDQA